MPRKAAKYLVPFSYHLLNHPMNVGERSAESGNHLFETFAPLLLARERVEFHEIKGHEIIHPLEATLINDFLDETSDYCFVLRCCHEILSFSAHCWHSVNRARLLLYPQNRVLCGLGNTKFDDGLGWNLDLLLRLRIEAGASLPFLLYAGLFKWRQFEPEVILLAVGWYLRFSLSYRDVEELLAERGLSVDHVTVWRWVQRYAPEIQRRLRPRLRPTNDSWRVDETYIRVKGKWVYLYRAVDSTGATIDFLLSAKRDAAAAERFLAKALGGENHPAPRVINTDEHAGYPPAIVRLKAEEALEENCRHRPVQYLNNVLEQDHRAIKRRVRASQHFRSFWGAWRTIAGYEAIHMIRKGQACWSAAGAKVGLLHRFILGLFAATS